jgi:hypothetical protein
MKRFPCGKIIMAVTHALPPFLIQIQLLGGGKRRAAKAKKHATLRAAKT